MLKSDRQNYAVFVEALDAAKFIGDIDSGVEIAAVQALNKAADRARTRSAKSIYAQVAFPAGYLSPSAGRLSVTKKATRGDMESIITGRARPTSLARFVKGSAKVNKAGVNIEVDPGHTEFLRRAFLIKLRVGVGTETRNNLGLAVRTGPGQKLRGSVSAKLLAPGLYLLYGPSVDQVFFDVAQTEAPRSADDLEAEFNRLLDLR